MSDKFYGKNSRICLGGTYIKRTKIRIEKAGD